MTDLIQIHPDYQVYFRTYGKTVQTRITQLSPKTFTSEDRFLLIEPGRVLLIGDLDRELRCMLRELGKPAINDLTSTEERKTGAFSTRAFESLRRHLYGDSYQSIAPRSKPSMRVSAQKEITFA